MIASMTAFSHQSLQSPWGTLTWELRAVNHRFLDSSLRLPENFKQLEPLIREKIQGKIQRGKIEAQLKFNSGENAPLHWSLNLGVVKELSAKCQAIKPFFPDAKTDLLAILSWPQVLSVENNQQSEIHQLAIELLSKTLNDLQQMRLREGSQTKVFIEQRLQRIIQIVKSLETEVPQLLVEQRERLKSRLADLNLSVDPQRLEQEIVLLIQKFDIAEEIQRVISHCEAMNHALSAEGAQGRRLDFLTQELHREANTLGSKASAVSVNQASIELKVWIEQIREQVQNIE